MKVKIQQVNEGINSIGGISLLDELFNSLKVLKKIDSMRMNKVKTEKIKHSGIIKTIAGLFGIGKNDYADVTHFCDCLKLSAFNTLRLLSQSALKMKEALPRKFKVQRRRLRSVIQDLIYIACKRTRHSGSIFLKLGRHCPWFDVFRQLHSMYC